MAGDYQVKKETDYEENSSICISFRVTIRFFVREKVDIPWDIFWLLYRWENGLENQRLVHSSGLIFVVYSEKEEKIFLCKILLVELPFLRYRICKQSKGQKQHNIKH